MRYQYKVTNRVVYLIPIESILALVDANTICNDRLPYCATQE